jgi:ATP-dependent DNA helicase RecG
MRRLLQGDVGSGKTLVAALAALQAIENGWQAALMAPTEILAEQHYLKLTHWLEPLGVKIAWLSAGLKAREKKAALEAIAAGTTQLAIGTHALFQEGYRSHVSASPSSTSSTASASSSAWRSSSKGGEPHQLMMSATPIPRTLSMSYYADLDVTVIDEMPPGARPCSPSSCRGAARRGDRARARGLRRGRAGLLGVPADRGVRAAAAEDRHRDLRDPEGARFPT